jgi:hypothetical protein
MFKRVLPVACLMALNAQLAAGAAVPGPFTIPVLVLSYFPTNGSKLDLQVTGDCGQELAEIREKTRRQTQEIIQSLQEGSRYRAFADSNAAPTLRYKIAGTLEFLSPLPTRHKVGHRTPMTDYQKILSEVNTKDWVENKGVKEVWIWGYHGGKIDLWESNMASRFGDVSNSDQDQNDLPLLQTTYTVYHYNYGRGTSEAIEDHIHQIEAVLNAIDGRDKTPEDQWPDLLFWGRFVGSDRTHKIVRPGCGWAHYPPNGEKDYDWANKRLVETDMDDWQPDGTGRKSPMNCDRWGGKSLGWFVFWMQHLPGPGNQLTFKGKPLQNWWVFIGDYDYAKANDSSLTIP